MNKKLDYILSGLMGRYRERVPVVGKILETMVSQGIVADESQIENDHIAFRTMGVPNLGIASLEKIFLHLGYERRDAYQFDAKKLNAFWYSPPEDSETDSNYPRIFISELRVDDLSPEAARLVRTYTDEVKSDPVAELNLDEPQEIDNFLHQGLWRLPSLSDYQQLLKESEYAAWVIYNRYYLNHFTISVHNLPAPHNDLEKFNEFLESIDVRLNDAGGKIKTSPDGLLRQSSTVAEMVEADFRGDDNSIVKQEIAGSYVEFAERRVLPEFSELPIHQVKREHRRDGFEAGNADKIFESTFRSQTEKQ